MLRYARKRGEKGREGGGAGGRDGWREGGRDGKGGGKERREERVERGRERGREGEGVREVATDREFDFKTETRARAHRMSRKLKSALARLERNYELQSKRN